MAEGKPIITRSPVLPARCMPKGLEILLSPQAPFETLVRRPSLAAPTLVRWGELYWLSAVRPWPAFHVRWPLGERTFSPPRGTGISTRQHERFAEGVERLFDEAAKHLADSPERIDRGWLEDPDLVWERADELPEPELPQRAVGHGAFRSSVPPQQEIATAIRSGPTSFEAMLQWLASRPDRWWRDHPREVRTTSHHVYVERRDRSLWRIPMVVRERRGTEDAIFVFGRRAELVLPYRDGCPVRAVLDAAFAAQPPDAEAPKTRPPSTLPPKPRGTRF